MTWDPPPGVEDSGGGAAVAAPTAVDPMMEWQCMTDPATGDAYYWNTKTGAVQWEMPDAEEEDEEEDEDEGEEEVEEE